MPAGPPVIVLISTDPRASHRANEAMRIGLGIVAGENDVVFVLLGAGAHLLDEDTDELVDGDDIAKFRANLKSLGVPFHVLWCRAPVPVLRERVMRRRQDASDADVQVLDLLSARYEPPEGVDVVPVDTTAATPAARLLQTLGEAWPAAGGPVPRAPSG